MSTNRRGKFKTRTKTTCQSCGKEFEYIATPSRLRDSGPAKFCSIGCRTQQWQGKNHPRWVDGGVELAPHSKWGYLRRQYQLTEEKFFNLLAKQNGVCPVCKKPLVVDFANRHGRDALVIDHDHRCCSDQKKSCGRCIRGILHMSCNTGMGALGDSPVLCRNAAEYLENYYGTQSQNQSHQ